MKKGEFDQTSGDSSVLPANPTDSRFGSQLERNITGTAFHSGQNITVSNGIARDSFGYLRFPKDSFRDILWAEIITPKR